MAETESTEETYKPRQMLMHDLAEVIWNASRADESTISATGANIVARAVLASGLLFPTAEVEALAAKWQTEADYPTGHPLLRQVYGQHARDLRALLARLAPGGTGTTEAGASEAGGGQ